MTKRKPSPKVSIGGKKLKLKQELNVYQQAKDALSVSWQPGVIPHRPELLQDIKSQVVAAIKDRQGCCIYVSGVPGTGKTSTTKEVLRQLHADNELKFRSCEINGMALSDAAGAYQQLWRCVSNGGGKKLTVSQSQLALDEYFNHQRKLPGACVPIVVLMDELDLLLSKKQSLIYNFFNWPTRPSQLAGSSKSRISPLIVIAIANTMDLPERALSNKVNSRLGMRRVEFPAYRHNQLMAICHERVGDLRAADGTLLFQRQSLEMCARKVAAVSGDARRVLDVCKRAVDFAEQRQTVVTLQLVQEAYEAMYSSPTSTYLQRSATLYQKIVLCSMLLLMRQQGHAELAFKEVFTRTVGLCLTHSIVQPSCSEVSRVIAAMGALRVLVVQQGTGELTQLMRLNCSEEDVRQAILQDSKVKNLLPL